MTRGFFIFNHSAIRYSIAICISRNCWHHQVQVACCKRVYLECRLVVMYTEVRANHRNASHRNLLVRSRGAASESAKSLSPSPFLSLSLSLSRERENAYGETNRRSEMSGIDWVFRLVSTLSVLSTLSHSPSLPPLVRSLSLSLSLSPSLSPFFCKASKAKHTAIIILRARFVNGFYLWHCKLYNQPPQGRRLI